MTDEDVSKKTNKLNFRNHIVNNVGAGLVYARKSRGITLIALVVTIIVILILVAVIATIAIAINGGLFGSAKDAKSQIQTGHGGTYDATPKNDDGTLTKNATWEDEGGKAVIPKGFKVVYGISGEQSIDSGLVIEDAEGNQFVWIPVTYEATGELDEHELDSGFLEVFYRSAWSNNARTTGLSSNYTEPYASGYQGEDTEYYEMMKSVQKNGGFYIGRYEAGSTEARTETSGDTTMVVKRDQYPYNYVAWGKSMSNIDDPIYSSGHGAVYLSKHMYDGKDVGVTSTLCYGVEWDAMLDFIKDEKDVSNSIDWGNYRKNDWTIDRAEAKYYNDISSKWNSISEEEGQQKSKDDDTVILLTTGSSDSFAAKNIYDVAGNCYEWTMEAYSTDKRVVRRTSWTRRQLLRNPRYARQQLIRSSGFGTKSAAVSMSLTFQLIIATAPFRHSSPGDDERASFRPALYIKN